MWQTIVVSSVMLELAGANIEIVMFVPHSGDETLQ